MFFSKKGAKVLAIASTFAFVLTGMSVAPGKAQAAADQAPTVKVLGATLRLDGDSGKQSLRFGIEVSNASNAEACGIDITCNGTTVTVGTDVENATLTKKNTTVYSKDMDNDKIVYSAVVTGITNGNYDKDFSVKGYVKEKVAEEAVTTSGVAEKRSVSSVVETLKKKDATIQVNADGDLVKVVDGKEEKLTKDDEVFKDSTIPEPEPDSYNPEGEGWTKVDLASLVNDGNKDKVSYNSVSDRVTVKGVNNVEVPLDTTYDSGVPVDFVVRGYNNNSQGIRFWAGGSSSSRVSDTFSVGGNSEFTFSQQINTSDSLGDKKTSFNKMTIAYASWGATPLDCVITSVWYRIKIDEPDYSKTVKMSAVTVKEVKDSDAIGETYKPYNSNTEYTVTNKGTKFTPDIIVTKKTIDCSNLHNRAGVTLKFDRAYDPNEFGGMVIRYANSTWVGKSAIISFKGRNGWIEYYNPNKIKYTNAKGEEVEKANCLNWGYVFVEQSEQADPNGYLPIIFNTDGTIPTTKGKVAIDPIEEIKIEWTALGSYKRNDEDVTAEAVTQSLSLQEISFTEKEDVDIEPNVAPEEYNVDFSDSIVSIKDTNGAKVDDARQLVINREAAEWPSDVAVIDIAGTYDSNNYSKITIEYEYKCPIDTTKKTLEKNNGTVVVKVNDLYGSTAEYELDETKTTVDLDCSKLTNVTFTPWAGTTGIIIKSVKLSCTP